MSNIQYVTSVIVFDDGHCEVMWDSSVSMEECYRALKQVTTDLENALGHNPPPKPSKPATITRLK